MSTDRGNVGQCWAKGFVATMLCFFTVWVPSVGAQSSNHAPPQRLISPLLRGEPSQEGKMDPGPAECPPEESVALSKTVPLYVHWHWLRHAQWQQDEVVDPILEAIAKEEEGQEGTIQGRGPVFRLMLAMLAAADPALAEQVKSGIPVSVVLDNLRAGAAGRTREVARLAQQFGPALTCLRRHRQALEYLTALNRMPHFPQPIVDPDGEIGPFVGAYMRKHILVDHEVITQSIVIAALHAAKVIQPSVKRSAPRAASLRLIETALDKLNPTITAEERQGRGEKALKALLEGRAERQKSQAKARKDYEDAYRMLAKAYQDALIALAPPPQKPAPARDNTLAPRAHVERSVGEETGSPALPRLEVQPARAQAASSEKRVALVIGNNRYPEAPLENTLNDAQAMARLLRDTGFEVIERENLTKRAMEDEIRAFGKRLRSSSVGLFYFAGHGLQVNGANYLVAIGSTIEKEQDVEYETVDARRVLSEMEAAETHLNIVILDACRNNPLTRNFRSALRGLAPMDAPSGTVIAYATAPGAVALDGEGLNGLYTQELLRHMGVPGLKLEEIFKRVRVSVKEKSRGKQLPWETSSLEGDFYFVKP